jgi:CheY-like chemotaxis protein
MEQLQAKEPRTTGKVKVVVIDYEEDFARMTKAALEIMGRFEVVTAGNGRSGINRARAFNPDVILLNVVMPDMNGCTIAQLLREDPITSDIPVLLLTADGGQEEGEGGGPHNGDHHLISRPRTAEELVKKISSVLSLPDL